LAFAAPVDNVKATEAAPPPRGREGPRREGPPRGGGGRGGRNGGYNGGYGNRGGGRNGGYNGGYNADWCDPITRLDRYGRVCIM